MNCFQKLKKGTWSAFVVLCCITTALFADTISLTSPPTTIVVEKDAPASVRFAGGELQAYLQKITGKKFDIMSVPAVNAANIFLGKSRYSAQAKINTSKLAVYGYIIKAVHGNLYILGNDSKDKSSEKLFALRKDLDGYFRDGWQYSLEKWDFDMGTTVGVWRFLETLGVRWLFPGDLGECLPNKTSIEIAADLAIQKAPHFKSRVIYGNNWPKKDKPSQIWHYIYPEEGEELHWSGNNNMLWILRQGGANKFIAMNHRPPRHLWYKRFGNSHPEYFALRNDGKRNIPSQTHVSRFSLCYSSKGMYEETMKDVDAFFSGKRPNIRGIGGHGSFKNNNGWMAEAAYGNTFSLLPHDTYAPCTCKECQKQIDESKPIAGQLSNLVWGFVKKVADANAKKFPGDYFTNLAYSAYSLPPDNIKKLPDNVLVVLCMSNANNVISAVNPEYMKNMFALSDEWMTYTNHKPAYWLHFLYRWNRSQRKYIPMLIPTHLGKFFKEIAKRSENVKIEVDRNSRTYEFINRYVLYKLMWDPQLDAKQLRDDFILHYFGPEAYAEMKKLLGEVEQDCMKIAASNASNYTVYTEYFNREALNRYKTQMNTAIKMIKEPMSLKRATLFQKFFFGAMEIGLNNFEKKFKGALKSNILICTKTKDKITLDGEFTEQAWQDVPKWDFYQNVTASKMEMANVKLLYDNDYLYFAFNLQDLNRAKHAQNNRFGDIGICLDSNSDKNSYYKVQLFSNGKMQDMLYQGDGEPPHEAWESHAKYAIKLLKDAWQAEVAIPRKRLGVNQNIPPKKWRINLYYNMAAPPRQGRCFHSSTSSIMIGDFNQPGLFSGLAFAHYQQRFNLLPNASFENGQDNKLTSWKMGDGGKQLKTEKAIDGNAVISLIRTKKDFHGAAQSVKFSVKPGVFFEYMGKHQGTSGRVALFFYDKNGKGIPNTALSTYVSGFSNWKSFRISGAIPEKATAVIAELRCWSYQKPILFDDVKFVSEK
ncbi:MAG: DUF4838 domain-containing protein [Lentisphaeria bacterium]